MKKVLDRVSDALDAFCGAVSVVMLFAMVIVTTAQIICRTWFTALTWSDEVTRYLLIWSTFLGATCVYRHSGNISITFIQEAFPASISKALKVLVHVICLILFAVLLYYGCQYVTKLNKTATSLPIKMRYIFVCVPLSMGILMVHALRLAIDETRKEVKG